MRRSFILCVLLASRAALAAAQARTRDVPCDIVVAGGSLASTAAAIAASNASRTSTVCYIDITDWPGGQATASGTSAIDFGDTWSHFPDNLGSAFAALLVGGDFGDASFNPGGCTVSTKCFPPAWVVGRLLALLAALPNLRVFLQTAVIGTTIDAASGRATAVTAVQRTPTATFPGGYERDLSAALDDWYSPADSAHFTKELITFALSPGGVVIEATEFGDVLMTAAGVRVAQGMEVANETSLVYDDRCGQAATMCFWMSWSDAPAPQPDPAPPGSDVGYPFPHSTVPWTQSELDGDLVWRRSATANTTLLAPQRGDLFLINEQSGNDLLNGQVFLPLAAARMQAPWRGGINLTALAMAEQRAYGYYHDLKAGVARVYPAQANYTLLNATAAGTTIGLAKMPYLRESRRAQHGIQGFRLCSDFAAVNGTGPGGPGCWFPAPEEEEPEPATAAHSGGGAPRSFGRNGFRWVDTVGIGAYGFDIHHFNADYCAYPPYLNYTPDPGPSLPYYLPFRAHTVDSVPNLLVAGKGMAQTFLANAVTRLHPTEWASGTAAGSAAALMLNARLDNRCTWSARSCRRCLQVSRPPSGLSSAALGTHDLNIHTKLGRFSNAP